MRTLAAFLLLALTGCTPGLLYTNITEPLTDNMDNTPVGTRMATLHTQEIRIPLPRAPITAEWSNHAIGEAAKQAGLEKIYYADLHTVSFLLGIWNKQTVRVWGE